MNAVPPKEGVAVPQIPIKAIVASPTNPRKRIDDAYIAELAEPKALERALKKAGIEAPHDARAETRARRDEERKTKADERKAESDWRGRLADALIVRTQLRLHDADAATLAPLLVRALLHQQATWAELDEALLKRWEITLPEEYNDTEEADRIAMAIAEWPAGKMFAFLIDALTQHEREVSWGEIGKPHALLALAEFLEFDPESLRETTAEVQPETAVSTDDEFAVGDHVRVKNDVRGPNGKRLKVCGRDGTVEVIDGGFIHVRFGPKAHEIHTNLVWNELEKIAETPASPSQAAQASEEGTNEAAPAEEKPKAKAAKKPKAKADPAPATPANEPAAPVKSEPINPLRAWPFPTGACA